MSSMSGNPPETPELVQCRHDCGVLSAGRLRAKYPREYRSWDNMKQRRRKGLCEIAPELEDFRSYLFHVGPRPAGERRTADRITNAVRAYGPDLVKWSTAKEQANNRSTTLFLTIGAETLPLTSWAENTGQKADTIRKRLARGWSASEAVLGRTSSLRGQWPGPQEPDRLALWERRYRKRAKADAHLSRPAFFIAWVSGLIERELPQVRRVRSVIMFLQDGTVPTGVAPVDMDVTAHYALEDHGSVAAMQEYLDRMEVLMADAEKFLPEARAMAQGQTSDDE